MPAPKDSGVNETHRFQDEWLLRAVRTIPGVDARLPELRAHRRLRLFDALVEGGGVSEGAIREAIRSTHRVAAAPPDAQVERPAAALLSEKLCRRYRIAPLRLRDEVIELAMENPLDLIAQADVHALTARTPLPLHALPDQLDMLLAQAYSPDHLLEEIVERLDARAAVEVIADDDAREHGATTEDVRAPVVRLVGSLLAKAFHMKASDIHLEHEERGSFVRFRVDGALRNIATLPLTVGAGPVVARLKIMANLDIADRLRPQDGRAKLRIANAEIGLRVSTLPTNYGEKVVIRLLDKRAAEVPLDKLGMRPQIVAKLDALIHKAQGLLLVTGPTGSGKTTTLYAALNRRKAEHVNIVTVEDPIEYKLEGINQVQINERQGLSFAAVLRSILRQDPNVILIGEIRDRETAEIGIRAAQTGHLVMSTLHTNDAISTVSRLVDMGIERFKLASGLNAISSQRLVRSLCPNCRVPAEPDAAAAGVLSRLGREVRLFAPKGCESCGLQGYKGRISLVELLEVTPALRQKISAGASETELREFALSEGGLSTMLEDALWHVDRGDTTLAEVLPHVNLGPAAAAASAALAAHVPDVPPRAEPPARRRARPRVLLVDDDAGIRTSMRDVFEQNGYEVEEAPDGASGLALALAEPPDALITDLGMPGLNGHDLVSALRESSGLSRLPILMLTSDTDERSQLLAFEAGADDYIMKPAKVPVVLARLRAALRRSVV
jgi:type II secretory ATPase GspE/PulE/Tfp pilus assembly ATPase PilB-like protein